MKEEQDGWTERRESGTKGRQQNTRRRRWRIIKGERESRITVINNTSAAAPPLHHDLERSNARRMTEERWRGRVEGRKNGRKKVKAMNGENNRARDQCVRTTERGKRDA